MFDFLPYVLKRYVIQNRNDLCELRIRKNAPILAVCINQKSFIFNNGKRIIADEKMIEDIVISACKNSLYIYNESIKDGYISCGQGIRIGIAGECVYNNGYIQTIKNFSSLNIRFPHEVLNVSNNVLKIIDNDFSIKSLLVISPPGVGKTTLIRDLARNISITKMLNVLVIDEKNEIFYEGCTWGETCDVICNCKKDFGFYNAIKTLNPQVIIADELTNNDDAYGALFASLSGVKIICTIHGESISDVQKKDYMNQLFLNNCFEKFVLLKKTTHGFNAQEVYMENK